MKKTITTILIIGAVYAGIYYYQRYQRKKANEREATYDEAIKAIDDL